MNRAWLANQALKRQTYITHGRLGSIVWWVNDTNIEIGRIAVKSLGNWDCSIQMTWHVQRLRVSPTAVSVDGQLGFVLHREGFAIDDDGHLVPAWGEEREKKREWLTAATWHDTITWHSFHTWGWLTKEFKQTAWFSTMFNTATSQSTNTNHPSPASTVRPVTPLGDW